MILYWRKSLIVYIISRSKTIWETERWQSAAWTRNLTGISLWINSLSYIGTAQKNARDFHSPDTPLEVLGDGSKPLVTTTLPTHEGCLMAVDSLHGDELTFTNKHRAPWGDGEISVITGLLVKQSQSEAISKAQQILVKIKGRSKKCCSKLGCEPSHSHQLRCAWLMACPNTIKLKSSKFFPDCSNDHEIFQSPSFCHLRDCTFICLQICAQRNLSRERTSKPGFFFFTLRQRSPHNTEIQ